jgi:hypothetical protein
LHEISFSGSSFTFVGDFNSSFLSLAFCTLDRIACITPRAYFLQPEPDLDIANAQSGTISLMYTPHTRTDNELLRSRKSIHLHVSLGIWVCTLRIM